MHRTRSLGRHSVVGLVCFAAWADRAGAQTRTWIGGSTTTSSWTDRENWSPFQAPRNDGTEDLEFKFASPRLTPTHAGWSIHGLTFDSDVADYEILGTGPLEFKLDPARQFTPQPVFANDGTRPGVVRGDVIIPAGVSLQGRSSSSAPITFGNATGSRLYGGGTLLLNARPDGLNFRLDNAATTPGQRGMELAAVGAYFQDPQSGPVHGNHLTIVPANPTYTGTGSSIDVANLGGQVNLRFRPDGANGNSVGFAPTRMGVMSVYGDERAAGVARAGADAPRVVFNGVTTLNSTIDTHGNVTITGGGNEAIDGLSGGRFRLVGSTATFGSAHPDATKTLRLEHDINVVPYPTPATAVFDPTLGATGNVTNRKTEFTGNVRLQGDSMSAAAVVFRSSARVTSGPAMTFKGTISGTGIVRMDAGSDQFEFSPESRIGPGELHRGGDLRFEGTGPNLAHLFTPQRLRGMTGSGVVEFRRTDNQLFDLEGNVWSNGDVGLRVTDSNPTGLDARLNGAGGTHFTGTVHLERGATFDVAGNRLNSVRGAGTLVGPAEYGGVRPGFASQGGMTLTGESTGLSQLTIESHLNRGPLEHGRLHATDDLALFGADGAPTRLVALHPGDGSPFQQLTIVSLDAGARLSGQFEGLPDGARVTGYGFVGTIRYNVDGGDGSANDVVLTLVPEPAGPALLACSAALALRRRRGSRANAATRDRGAD